MTNAFLSFLRNKKTFRASLKTYRLLFPLKRRKQDRVIKEMFLDVPFNVFLKTSFVLLAFYLPANGQSIQPLSLQQALQLGMQNSKQLQLTQAKAAQAGARYKETIDYYYPSVNLNAGYSRLSDVPEFLVQFPGEAEPRALFPVYLNSYESHLSANELVFAGFRAKYAKASADFLQKAAELDVEKDKDEVAFNIVNAYYNIYKLSKGKEIIKQNLEVIKQRTKELQAWEREGITLHNDVVRTQLLQSNYELSAIDADNALKTAIYNFNLLIGLDPESQTEIDTASIFTLPELKPLNDYMQMAMTSRSDLESIKTRNLSAENILQAAQKDYWPTVSIGGNLYYSNPPPRYIPPIDQFKLTWDAGINLNWSITNLFTNKHQVEENKAIVAQGKSSYDLLQDGVKSEIYASYLGATESTEKLKTLQTALTQATENFQLMDSRYRNSVALLSDLIDAQSSLLAAQINYAIGKADSQIAWYRLMKATGTIQ